MEEEEEDPIDHQEVLREKCTELAKCSKLKEELDACNERVSSRKHNTEKCTQEVFDFVHCVDHCVSLSVHRAVVRVILFTCNCYLPAGADLCHVGSHGPDVNFDATAIGPVSLSSLSSSGGQELVPEAKIASAVTFCCQLLPASTRLVYGSCTCGSRPHSLHILCSLLLVEWCMYVSAFVCVGLYYTEAYMQILKVYKICNCLRANNGIKML